VYIHRIIIEEGEREREREREKTEILYENKQTKTSIG